MSRSPQRLKESDDLDPFARELLRAARPTRPMPAANSLRGAHRVARLAAAPAVALGVGLWSKAVGAAFAVGFTSALGLVALSPALQARIVAPPVVEVSTAAKSARAPSARPAPAMPTAPAASSPTAPDPSVDGGSLRSHPEPRRAAGARAGPPQRSSPSSVAPVVSVPVAAFATDGGAAPSSLALLQPDPAPPGAAPARFDLDMSEEVSLLSQARQLVASDPARALVLLHRHAVRFPKPALGMEREVLVIEALD